MATKKKKKVKIVQIDIEHVSIHLEENVTIDGVLYLREETNDQILWEQNGEQIEDYDSLEGIYQTSKIYMHR